MTYYLFAFIHLVFYSVRVDLHRSGGYGGYGQQQQGGYGGYGQDQGGYGQQGGYGGGGRFIFFRFLRSVAASDKVLAPYVAGMGWEEVAKNDRRLRVATRNISFWSP